MSRDEFMKQLETLLTDVSQEEKIEALEYYRGYFEDAGEENEERIIRELESPEKVAQIIKADLRMEPGAETGQFTENGYEDNRFKKKQEMGFEEKPNAEFEKEPSFSKEAANDSGKSGKIALIVIIAVLTCPLWISLAAGLFGGIVGILGGIFGIAIAAIAVTGAFYVTGAVLIGVGIGQFFVGGMAVAFALTGAGLLVLALAILGTIACVWGIGKFIPWVWIGTAKLFRNAFPGRGKKS